MKYRLLSTQELNKLPVSGFGQGGYYYKINKGHHFFPRELFRFLGKEFCVYHQDDTLFVIEIPGPPTYRDWETDRKSVV